MDKIEVIIPMKELWKLKVPFYLVVEEVWEKHCLKRLKEAGAPIKTRLIGPPVIERGRVYREDLIDKDAIRVVWEDDDE